MKGNEKSKKPYVSPLLKTTAVGQMSVLLVCTGEYNCTGEVGYDCCQPNATTCFTNC